MNRDQLEHVLRAAADIVPDSEMLVIGSQAVLAERDADAALLRVGVVDASVLIERIEGLPDAVPAALRDAIRRWLARQASAPEQPGGLGQQIAQAFE